MDKRTKAYKDSVKKQTPKYEEREELEAKLIEKHTEVSHKVGDKLESLLKKTGIDKVVKFLAGEDCGCDERKAKLNAMFTYSVNCLNEDEFTYLDKFFKRNPSEVQPSEYIKITKIAGRVTNRVIDSSMGCSGCVRKVVTQMKQIYDTYEA